MGMMQMMQQGGGGGGKGGKGKGGGNREPDPPGSGRVFVRGFDFGVTDEQLEAHMSQLGGKVLKMHWATKGSAAVVFKTKKQAQDAANSLQGSVIEGNSRYIDVLLKESE